MRRKILLPFLLLLGLSLRAETAPELFRKVNAAYEHATNVSMEVHYNLFADYVSQQAYESNDGKYIRQGGNFYSSLLGITTVQNKKYRISVSNSDQLIIVSDPLSVAKAPSLVETDSLLSRCSSTEVIPQGQGKRLCILHFEKTTFSEFDRIEFEVDASDFISKMTLFYREAVKLDDNNPNLKKEKPRLEISYTNINTNPVISADQFSEKPFIVVTGKQITCSASYHAFRLLNHKQ